jgi:hypothetical protein
VGGSIPSRRCEVVALVISNKHFLPSRLSTFRTRDSPAHARDPDHDFYRIFQTSILTMANERNCSHRQDDAMDVCNRTDWFKTLLYSHGFRQENPRVLRLSFPRLPWGGSLRRSEKMVNMALPFN